MLWRNSSENEIFSSLKFNAFWKKILIFVVGIRERKKVTRNTRSNQKTTTENKKMSAWSGKTAVCGINFISWSISSTTNFDFLNWLFSFFMCALCALFFPFPQERKVYNMHQTEAENDKSRENRLETDVFKRKILKILLQYKQK